MDYKMLQSIARKKGLVLIRNSFIEGYCIVLPNHSTYNADDLKDVADYLKGY